MIDIVEKLSKFPIAEWQEAKEEILKLRKLINTCEINSEEPIVPKFIIDSNQDTFNSITPSIVTIDEDIYREATLEIETLRYKVIELSDKLKSEEVLVESLRHCNEVTLTKNPMFMSLKEQLSDLRSDLVTKTLDISNTKLELDSLNSNINNLNILLEFKTKEVISLENDIRIYIKETDILKDLNTSRDNTISNLKDEICSYIKELSDLKDLDIVKDTEVSKLSKMLSDLKTNSSYIEKESFSLWTKVKKLF